MTKILGWSTENEIKITINKKKLKMVEKQRVTLK